jgi:hypothetical protein
MHKRDWLASILALLLLAGAAVDRLTVLPPVGSAEYHARVHAVAAQVEAASCSFGDWSSDVCPIPGEAVKLLRPNVTISRRYANRLTGESLGFLLIQCTDVRDMLSHFPPICYPYRGLSLLTQGPVDLSVKSLDVAATEYQFESSNFESANLTTVENFMIVPGESIAPDMDQVTARLKLRSRYLGAAQVQIVFNAATPPARRQQISREFIAQYNTLISDIASGVPR